MKPRLLNLNRATSNIILAVVPFSVIVTAGRLIIEECEPNKQINISGNGYAHSTFTCNGVYANESVQWVLGQNTANALSFQCGPFGEQCETSNPGINMSRPMAATSTLTIERNYWQETGYGSVLCSTSSNVYTCSTNVVRSLSTSPSSTGVPGIGTTTEEKQNEDDSKRLLVEAIGGGVAAFIVILLFLLIGVVVFKRRKSQKAAGNTNNELEEHVNSMNGSGADPDTTSPSNSKPSGVALRIPTDTSNSNNATTLEDADNAFDASYSSVAFGEQQTSSPSSASIPGGHSSQNTSTKSATYVVVTDADLYTTVDDMEQEQTSGPEQDHAGGYSTEGSPKSSSTAAPSGDVYAVVQKSGPMAQCAPATSTVSPNNPGDSADGAYASGDVSRSSAPASPSKAPSGDPVSDNADNTYAVVNKSSSQGKGTGASTTPDSSHSTQQAQSGDVYAQVDNSSNDDEGQSNVYAQVDKTSKGNNSTPVQQTQVLDQKPEPGIKPKPAFKPKPSSNV